MPRLMSVSMTEQAVRDRTKTVTRRKGWQFLKPGARVTLCRKVMGRKPGELLERIVDVEIVDVRRETLGLLLTFPEYGAREVELEGFPGLDAARFIDKFFINAQGMQPRHVVTRIEWRYLDPAPGPFGDKEAQQ